LEEIARRSFAYFNDWTHPRSGLVWDRVDAAGDKPGEVASAAATGFGLTALCIADARGWLPPGEAYRRVERALRFLADESPHVRGFYYHFVDPETGERRWTSELSSIDTALLIAGVITCRQHWPETSIRELADRIISRVEWPWMLQEDGTLSMGWTPEGGFLSARWGWYNELMILLLLGLAAPEHALPADAWHAWKREPVITYGPYTFIQCPPLFTHQYSHAWIDFQGRRDAYADYFLNSALATRAQLLWSMDLQPQFPAWNERVWGLSASDSRKGYAAWGGPPPTVDPLPDGSIVPYAVAGSMPFAPEICTPSLLHQREAFADAAWGRYGFVSAFDPHDGWSARAHLGIDVGITLLMLENWRSGFVWKKFMSYPPISNALERAGFVRKRPGLADDDRRYLEGIARDTWRSIASMVHPETGLPSDDQHVRGPTSVSNIGLYLSSLAAAAEWGFITEAEAEAAAARVLDVMERWSTRHGFSQCWHDVEDGTPSTNDTWISLLDTGNLIGGLMVAGIRLPNLRARCDRILNAMEWDAFYRADRGLLIGGYEIAKEAFNPEWLLSALGTDARLAQFVAVGSGRVPPEMWERLSRDTETRHRAEYLAPGWQGGGLFMQFISGLWIDERGTLMRRSAENFAYAQIRHARERGYPVWGWSACRAPDGAYLGWGHLRDAIVTPHASALALECFPEEVIANLRELERRGARDPEFGFRDSIDHMTGAVSPDYLILDQTMLFLSLFNALHQQNLRTWFGEHPIARRAYEAIALYRERRFDDFNSSYRLKLPAEDIRERERARVAYLVSERARVRSQRTVAP
jgi:hypothetical protein